MRGYSMMLLIAALTAGAPLMDQAAAQHGGHGAPMQGQHMGTLDLNSAPLTELRQLPGVNEASAKKIVENRPYARADELVTKKVLSKDAYDNIKDHIAVTKPVSK
jgi:radical SAM superfamily enzyme with C-terminal helix-hairpin-helix motif